MRLEDYPDQTHRPDMMTPEDYYIRGQLLKTRVGFGDAADAEIMAKKEAAKAGAVRVLICEECGSDAVVADAAAEWHPQSGEFVLSQVYDVHRTVSCGDCGAGEQNGNWVWRVLPKLERDDQRMCSECGCEDIEFYSPAWFDATTWELNDNSESGSIESTWCPQCDQTREGDWSVLKRLAS